MSGNRFTLRDEDDMLERLRAVDDKKQMVEELYPLLLKYADTRHVPLGLVMIIQDSLEIFLVGKDLGTNHTILQEVPYLIDAMCPDDDSAHDTKKAWAGATTHDDKMKK